MTSADQPRRARRVWGWAAALVAACVAVPVVAVVAGDDPGGSDRGQLATSVSADDPSPSAETSSAATPSAEPTPTVSAAPATAPATAAARTKVRALFFGDSYFIGGGYTDERHSMARIASNRLGWRSEINGGGGTGFVQTNWEYGLGSYLDQIAAGAFDVGPRRWVVIEGGNNDLAQPLDQVRANARKVVRIAQRRFPDARIVLVGPLDTDSDHSELVPMIRLMRQVATKRGVPFINMKNWLSGHYDLVGPDTIHPYVEGHRILGRKLAKALRKLGA